MEDTPYTKRELDHFFVELNKRLDHQDGMLSEIKIQTLKTNGRVNKLEFLITVLKWICGVMWTAIPLAIFLLYRVQRLQSVEDSQTAVQNTLSQFNIVYQPPTNK